MANAPVKASEVEPEAPTGGKDGLTEEQRLTALHEYGVSTDPTDLKMVPLDLLVPAKKNPRRGQVAKVIESIREFGQHRPMVIRYETGEVTVGNHLYKALRQMGEVAGACMIVDEDNAKALRRGLADNFVGDSAQWDEAELAEVLKETGVVPGTSQSEVDKLLAKLEKESDGDSGEPTYPLVPQLNEKYDYVFVFAENETDWAWLETNLELRSERSYKSGAVGKSHVITVARLQELLGEKAGG